MGATALSWWCSPSADNRGGTGSATSSVVATNQAPVADFSVGLSPVALCSFDASASSDVDGSIVSYGWDFGDGTGGVGRTVEHTYGSDGTFVVVLTVTDNRGGTGSATSSVVTTNQAPVADFSVDVSVADL